MRGKIKKKHVVLVILQRGNQRQQFSTTGAVSVAKQNRRGAAQSWKEPAFARAQSRNAEGDGIGAARKTR